MATYPQELRDADALAARNRGKLRNIASAQQPQHRSESGQLTAPSGTPIDTWSTMFNRDPDKEAKAIYDVRFSGNRNVNTPNAQAAGAVAASPKPFMPSPYALNLPDQKAPEGMTPQQGAAWEKDALARNTAMTQPGGLRPYDVKPSVIPPTPLPYEARQSNPASGDVTSPTPSFTTSTGRQMNGDGSFVTPTLDRATAHADLTKSHPQDMAALMIKGTPQNTAFIQHASDRIANGMAREDAINEAYRNAPAIFAQFSPQVTGNPVTGVAEAKPVPVAPPTAPPIAGNPATPPTVTPVRNPGALNPYAITAPNQPTNPASWLQSKVAPAIKSGLQWAQNQL